MPDIHNGASLVNHTLPNVDLSLKGLDDQGCTTLSHLPFSAQGEDCPECGGGNECARTQTSPHRQHETWTGNHSPAGPSYETHLRGETTPRIVVTRMLGLTSELFACNSVQVMK